MSTYAPVATPLELDFVVNTFRNPGPSVSSQHLLGYLYNYLPHVKTEHNLRLIFASFLNNPVTYGADVPSFEENYMIIEVFKVLFDKKLKVSQPTLCVRTFYHVVLQETQNFVHYDPMRNSWKVLPILAGIGLSSELRDLLAESVPLRRSFSGFDNTIDSMFLYCFQNTVSASSDDRIVSLALISLALKFQRGKEVHPYLGSVSVNLVIDKLLALTFASTCGATCFECFLLLDPALPDLDHVVLTQVFQRPVVKHLNKISFLLEKLFLDLPRTQAADEMVVSALRTLERFNEQLNAFTRSNPVLNTESIGNGPYEQHYWVLMKTILFSEIIIFQGIVSRFLTLQKRGLFLEFFAPNRQLQTIEKAYIEICYLIVNNLFYLNFILISIGQGGFDSYNFVYYVCLELVLQNNVRGRFELVSRMLAGSYEVNLYPEALNNDYVSRSKVAFVLGLWENYFQQSQAIDALFLAYIYDVTFTLVQSPLMQDSLLIEAGHSVLLALFSSKKNTDDNLENALEYFELAANQFPQKLTAHQLSVAVETLGKKIMSNPIKYKHGYYRTSADKFLDFVYFRCSVTTPGQLIKQHKKMAFTSAQPVSEIEASSTLSQLREKSNDTNIVKANKRKKPKDLAYINIVPHSRRDSSLKGELAKDRDDPDTSREGLILALLNVIPYLPMSIFVHWLEKIWGLILMSNASEQIFLTGKLWKVLSENLDLNRCEVAYEWWYEEKQAVEHNYGNQVNDFKL